MLSVQKKKRHNKITFKKYIQNDEYFFPKSTVDYVPNTHISKLVSAVK